MKLSIKNFKSIKKLENYEIKNMNILTGVNSIGKTSLMQFLLMLKQTFEKNNSNLTIRPNGRFVKLGKFNNFITDFDVKSNLEFTLKFDFNESDESKKNNIVPRLPLRRKYILDYKFNSDENNELQLQELNYVCYVGNVKRNYYIKFDDGLYSVVTNVTRRKNENGRKMTKTLSNKTIESKMCFMSFIGIIPSRIISSDNENLNGIILGSTEAYKYLNTYFSEISYIGPLRDEPHNYYIKEEDQGNEIGVKGEFAVQLLSAEWSERVKFHRIDLTDKFEFVEKELLFSNAFKFWFCEIFRMSKTVKIDKKDGAILSKVYLENDNGKPISITQVGFGISQILPIIVEGLRMNENGILILEQPEIHLHPNVQAMLFDFLYSLVLQNKTVIVETHSDHFITRMRRRMIENPKTNLSKHINLTFVENNNGYAEYKQLEFDDVGDFNYWPEGFCDVLDRDYHKIVSAKMKRRISSNE